MRKLLGILFIVLLAVAACGGGDGNGDGGGDAGGGATETAADGGDSTGPPVELQGEVNNEGVTELSGTSLDVGMHDFYFEPTFVQVESGTNVEVTLTNEGNAPHTFTIEDQGIDIELGAGSSTTVDVSIDEGTVNFVCRFHVGQGMQGALYTEAGAAAPAGDEAGTESETGVVGY